jgi:hypothetical protein
MTMAEITLKDGSKIRTFPRAPTGFDPLTAAPAELEHYGFPPRRGDRRSLERYRHVWGRIKDKFQYTEPTFETGGARPRRSRQPIFSNTNWSGGVVLAPKGKSFCGVTAEWIIPNIYAPDASAGYEIASWIGLDGYTGSGVKDLLQAGIQQTVTGTGSTLKQGISLWWEWVPGNPVTITGVSISPGDLVSVTITTSGKGSTTATVAVSNLTNGTSTSVAVSAPSKTELVGTSAEWIVEMPFAIGEDTLPDYGEVYFSGCEAYIASGGEVTPGPGNGTTVSIGVGTPSSVVSEGVLISPGIVQCLYTGPPPLP